MTINEITTEVKSLLDKTADNQLRIASLINMAHGVFGSALEWLAWGDQQLGLRRRDMFRYHRVAWFIGQIDSLKGGESARRALLKACRGDFCKVEICSRMTCERLEDFLSGNDVAAMDRDELAAAVRRFIGAPERQARQLDFFASLNLPPPAELQQNILRHAKTINPETAADYGVAFFSAAVENFDQLSQEHREHYSKELFAIIRKLTGKHTAKG